MSITCRPAGMLSVIVGVVVTMGALAVPSGLPPRLAAMGPALGPTLMAHEARRPGPPSLVAEVPPDNLIATTFGPPLNQASVSGGWFQTLSSTTLSFGSQTLGTTSAPQTVTLTNTGIDPLGIHPDLVVSSDFVLVEPTTCGGGLAVPVGGSCTATVGFAPTTVGARTGTLMIGTDSSGTFVVNLTGIGVVAGPLGALSSPNLSFGIQSLSTTSADQWVILTNTGTAPLHITSIGGALSEGFHLAGPTDCRPERPLAVGGSCPIFVNFSPNEPWLRTGTLVVNSDAVNSPHVINLTGIGVPAEDVFFSNNFEADAAGWSSDTPWSVTTEVAHSGSRAWSDSPGGAYGANLHTSIWSPVIDLTNATSAQLVFWHRRQFTGTDRGTVWVNTAGGSTYSLVATYTGADPSWSQATVDLSAFAGTPDLRVVFQLQSDATQMRDGWYIDDVVVANVAPAPFGKIFPSDGATGLPTNVALGLRWQASRGETAYEYCYDTVNNYTCDTAWVDAGALNATASGLTAGATYFWQVRARLIGTTEADTGAWWSFTTNGDVSAPTVTGMVPASGATGVSTAVVTADAPPPTVLEVRPSSGETLVNPRTTVTAHFTEPIDAATLTTTSFVLSAPGGATVGATVSYDAVARVGQLTPSAALATATTYTATISTAVKDVAGNALTAPVIWSFTTAPPSTIGLTTVGSFLDGSDSNYMNGSKVTTAAAGQVSSMSVYVGAIDSVVANRQYQLAIYRDTAGRPGTLVAASTAGTLVANAWNTVALSAPLLANTNYWLMFNTNGRTGAVNNMRYNTGAAGQGAYSTAPAPFGAWPATFPAATTSNFVFSLYATLESNALGWTTIGSSVDSGNSNSLHGSRVTPTVTGQVSSMSVYVGAVDSLVANRQFQFAIYGDDAGGPGLLVASSASGTLVANAWNTLPISALLAGGRDYWLMFNTNGQNASVNNMYYTSGTIGRGTHSVGPEPFGTWPPLFTSAATTFVYSLFATVAPDTTRPTVAVVTPGDGATGVSTASTVTVRFSEPIKVATLTTGSAGTFVLRGPAGAVVPTTVDYTASNFTGTLTPSGALAPSTTYTATVSTGVHDLAGNALTNPVVWSFTTTAAAAPSAFGKQSPPNGSAGAIIKPFLGLTWQASAGAMSYEYCIDTVNNNACDAAWVTGTSGFGVGLAGLTAGTTYFWQVRARNAAGTTEANGGTWWSVTTNADATPPTVTGVTPPDGATGVSPTIVVTATFSEPIDTEVFAGSGAFFLSNNAGPVPVTLFYNTGALFATLTPVAPLAASTTYTATVSTLVKDMAGNQLASPVVWSFTTAASPDTTPPTVWKVRPSSGETRVSPRTTVMADFTDVIDAATLTTTSFVLRGPGGATVGATVRYDTLTGVGQLTPSAALAPATVYTATISTAVKDDAGNALAGPVVWSFTTAPPSTIGLTTVGSFLDGSDSNYMNGSKVTTTAAGQVSSMSVYVGAIDSVVANRQYQLAIYRDTAGRPGTLVAASTAGTLVANAWNTVALSAPLLASTNYWLMFNTNGRTGAVNNMRYNTGAAGQGAYSTAPAPFGVWPATFPAATTSNFVFSLYATLESNTLGLTEIGSSLDSGNSNSLHGSRVTATVSGQVSSMSVYVGAVDSLVANRQFQFAIYGDDAGGPGTRVASSASGTLVANAWNTLLISAQLVGGRDYWLMFNTNGRTASVNNMYYTGGTIGQGVRSLSPYPFGAWPLFFGPGGNTFVYSLFATLEPDTTRPTVVVVTPVDGATEVSWASRVTVQFSELINVATLTTGPSGTFVLRGPADVVPATVDYTASNFTGTLTPSGALAASTTYTATISTGVQDWAGNALASPVVWSFTTAAVAGPSAFGKRFPPDGSTGAVIKPYLALTWQASAGATSYEYCIDTVNNNVCDASWVTGTGGLGVAVSGLTAGTAYFWQVRGRNAAGTTEATGGTWWSVTTNTDVTPPTVTSVIPLHGATGVSTTTLVTATFSEFVDNDMFVGVPFSAFQLQDPANAFVAAAVRLENISGTHVATLTPSAPLAGSTTYTATISGGVIDLAGNVQTSASVWSFTTAAAAPSAFSKHGPPTGSTGIVIKPYLSLSWQLSSGATSHEYCIDTVNNNACDTAWVTGTTGPGVGLVGLTAGTTYFWQVRARNTAGTTEANGGTWWSVTTNTDVTPPTVTSVIPLHGATGVSPTIVVTAAFSEFVDNDMFVGVPFSAFQLQDPANAFVAAAVRLENISGTHVATLTPSAPLAGSTTYTATISGGVIDLAGNLQTSASVWSFTTAGPADTTPPTVTSVTPANGATGVIVSTAVAVTFSEPIDPCTLTTSSFMLRTPSGADVLATFSYNVGTRVATLTPLATLATATTYTVTVTTDVTDVAGNHLLNNFVASFTTAPPFTIGLTTVGSFLDGSDSNYMNGSKVTTTAAGQVSSMSVYVGAIDSMAVNRQYQLAIYRDNAGRPGTLVAASATGTLVANAWNTLTVSAPLLAGTNYWLMFNTNGRTGAVNNMRYNAGAAGQGAYSTASVPFGAWPATFPATTTSNFVFSLYASFGP